MPNRLIKESITTSENVDALSPGAEVLFYRLIVKADDFGSYHGNEHIVKSTCFPLREKLKASQVKKWLEELQHAGLIFFYSDPEGRQYLRFTKWEKHQQVRAKKSKYPQPQASDINCNQLRANVPVIQSNPIQSESNPNTNTNKDAQETVGDFDTFWKAYPKKVGKEAARRAFEKVNIAKIPVELMINAIEKQKQGEQWIKEDGRYIPNPATWLNQGRWEDEVQPAKAHTRMNPSGSEDFKSAVADLLAAGK